MDYPNNYNPFGYGSVLDSNKKWAEKAKESKVADKKKFDIGDRVKIRNSELDNSGVVKAFYTGGAYGMLEYCIDFEGKIHYCYEAELVLVSRKLQTAKCECGAEKTYGHRVGRLSHALYCPARGDEHA